MWDESVSQQPPKIVAPFLLIFFANSQNTLPVHRFNTAGHNEVGKNPNITLGKREEITGKVFCEFAKKISKKGATILGGCCETDSSHIKELSKLK